MTLFFLLLHVVFSCTERKKDHSDVVISATKGDLLVVDLDRANQIDTLHLSSFFKKATCIRLDDNNVNALVGSISKLLVFNERLYVLDKRAAKSLLVFNMDGTFIKKIGSVGQGPGEYKNIMDFTINPDKNEIILLEAPRVFFYDLAGNFLRSITLQNSNHFIYFFQYCDTLLYTSVRQLSDIRDDDCLIQSINMVDGSIENSFLNKKAHNRGWNELVKTSVSYFEPTLDPPYLYRHIFMDTIFSITDKGVHPYLVVRSKDMITEKDLVVPENINRFEFLLHNLYSFKKIHALHSFFDTPDYFHFQYEKGGQGSAESKNVVLNKKDGAVIKVGELHNDLIYKNEQALRPVFSFYDKTGVYEVIQNDRLSELFPFITDNQLVSPFNEHLKGLNFDSNPIIFYYEFKSIHR